MDNNAVKDYPMKTLRDDGKMVLKSTYHRTLHLVAYNYYYVIKKKKRKKKRERERECVCVCVCLYKRERDRQTDRERQMDIFDGTITADGIELAGIMSI